MKWVPALSLWCTPEKKSGGEALGDKMRLGMGAGRGRQQEVSLCKKEIQWEKRGAMEWQEVRGQADPWFSAHESLCGRTQPQAWCL